MSEFEMFILKEFTAIMKGLGYDNKLLKTSKIWQFRFICFKLNYFMKSIPLPKIKNKSLYEAVFVEFRILPHIEFLLRNAIYKIGNNWAFTIVCGKLNYKYMRNICDTISKDIKIIKLDYANMTQQEYSNMLTTETFWNLFNGEKILIYQEDSLIFQNNIKPFLQYDYIGAPFLKQTNDTPNCVGNGGFSLRTKCKMLEVIKNHKLKDLVIESSTMNYMKFANLQDPPEDVYFSKNMQENYIGDVADWDTAHAFSSETIFNPNSFAGHQFWIAKNEWKPFINDIFNFHKYKPKSNLNKVLSYNKLPIEFDKNDKIQNAFEIDLYFFCHANNISYVNDSLSIEYLNKICLEGFIYHPKQLLNIFPNIKIYNFLNNIYIFDKNNVMPVQEFLNKYLYNSNFDYLSELLIEKKHDTLNDNYDTLLLVFLGNKELSIDLLNRLKKYKIIQPEFNIAFCINTASIQDKTEIKQIIKDNFDFYAIYYSKEFGTDITPTMLMYNDIIKSHTCKHVLKFHTKTISDLYLNLTNYLIKTPIKQLIQEKKIFCNTVCDPKCYLNLKIDGYNNLLKIRHNNELNINNSFSIGTIFYAESIVFDKVLNFLKIYNYRSYLLNNLYENNSINHHFSPIHFLERLFGTIKL